MRRASRIETEQIEWLVPGIVARGMIHVISGRPDEGKSTLTNHLAAIVSKFAPVILSNHEDHAAITLKPRLEAAGARLDRVFIPEEPFLLPTDCEELERRIEKTGTALFIADSAAQHLAVSSSSGQQVRKALTPLKGLLERTGCAAIFVDHLIKRPSKNGNPLEALAGAGSGLPAAARFVYVFGRNPHDQEERILAMVKGNNVADKRSFAYSMSGATVHDKDGLPVEVGVVEMISDESTVDASEVIAFNGGGKASEGVGGVKGAIAKEWLIGMLMFGMREASDLAAEGKTTGFSFRTLQRAAESLGMRNGFERKRIGAGAGSHVQWSLPDDHPALKVAKKMRPAVVQAPRAAAGAKPKAAVKPKRKP